MAATTNSLLRPITVGSHVLKNRIGMSAMTRGRAPHTYPGALMKEYYVQRAKGGAGLIVSEGILVTRQGTEWVHAPGIWDEKHIEGWKTIVDAVHEAGGKIYAQLWHLGRVSHPDAPEQKLAGEPVYAPSAITARGGRFRFLPGTPGYVTPTAIPDPRIIIDKFKQAAVNAKAAGFDGVEFHGANGYLNAQFLDTGANQRTDEWGGSIENRSRFGLEVLKVLKEVFDKDVALKLSPAGGYNDVGMPLQQTLDTYRYFISEADKLNLAYIALMEYSAQFDVEFDGVPRGTKHNVLESYRDSIKKSRLFLNNGITTEAGDRLVSEGKIDGIFVGMNWISHPDLVKRVERGVGLDNPKKFQNFFVTVDAKDIGLPPDVESWRTGYVDYPLMY